MMGIANSSVRLVSENAFEARCGKCLRLSPPVNALGPEHAWTELLKTGWTWCTSPVGEIGYASCLECLKASWPSPPRPPSRC